MNDDSLIVPIDIEALCVAGQMSDAGLRFRGATANFSSLPSQDSEGEWSGKPYIGESIDALSETMPDPGIRLHWALPDALTKATLDEKRGLTFPSVPNRWLVVRIVIRADAERHPRPLLRGWVVESDFQHADPAAATVSVPHQPEDGGQFHRYLGRSVALEDWREGADPGERFGDGRPLTAIGYGDTSFAAYYPNCRNVFGFHDALADLGDFDAASGDRLTYLVAGWFNAPALEPRLDPTPIAHGLAWRASPSPGGPPVRCLASGLIRAIAWNRAETPARQDAHALEIAIGNSQADCVSALLANRPNLLGDEEAVFLLDAVQSGMLTDHVGPDFHVKLDHLLHAASFATVTGETAWQIAASAERALEPRDAPPRTGVAISERLAEKLVTVNALESDLARATADLAARRETLVFDWRRFMQVLHATHDETILQLVPDLADIDNRAEFARNLRTLLEAECAALVDDAARMGTLSRPVDGSLPTGSPADSLAGQLATALAGLAGAVQSECGDAMALKAVPGTRFWEPVDPVLLLAGEDARPPVRYGGDSKQSADGLLPCRRTSELQATLTLDRSGRKDVFDASEWLAQLPLAGLAIAGDARALVAEALVTDPDLAVHVACTIVGAADGKAQAVAADIRTALHADAAGQGGAAVQFAGVPVAKIGNRTWQGNPWLPLFLDWEVEYAPLLVPDGPSRDGSRPFSPDALTARYDFDAETIDLVPRDAAASRTLAPVPLRGTGLLTQSAFRSLAASLDTLAAHVPDQQLHEAIAAAVKVPALSHVLTGFNQLLLARQRAMQLRVLDPFGPDDELTQAVATLAPDRDDVRARPFSPFLPIRGGYLRIASLSLIDVFGQERSLDIDRARLARARGLVPGDPSRKANRQAQLPPRFLQPARLNFRLLDARDDGSDAHEHPSSSPVCGWVVVNNLDLGLVVHTADGAACGTLRLIEDQSEAIWEQTPGSAMQAIADPHLAAFVQGVLEHENPAAFLAELADVIDRSLATIIPNKANSDEALNLLLGRPLALVRASLSLELKGGPRGRADWDMLTRRVTRISEDEETAVPDLDTLGFEAVKIPVRLGNLNQVEDGLVGYFREDAGGTDYSRFYAAAGRGEHGVEPSVDNPVMIVAADWQTPVRVTLLMDPFGTVHANCGLLPVKGIDIPMQHYTDALASLETNFPCGPVLASGEMRLPLPALAGYGWSWVEADEDGWQTVGDLPGTGERPTTSYSPLHVADGWLRLVPRSAPPGRERETNAR